MNYLARFLMLQRQSLRLEIAALSLAKIVLVTITLRIMGVATLLNRACFSPVRFCAAVPTHTLVVHTAVTLCLMCSAASVNGTHLWLTVTLSLLYASIALSIIVHVA